MGIGTNRTSEPAQLARWFPIAKIVKRVVDETIHCHERTDKYIKIRKRSFEDYGAIFEWFKLHTGRSPAYKTASAVEAYVRSLNAKPASYYDTRGFLASLGMSGVESYGRGREEYTDLIKYFKEYKEKKWYALFQKISMWLWQISPKLVFGFSDLIDNILYKEKIKEAWNNEEIPQPPIPKGVRIVSIDHIINRYYKAMTHSENMPATDRSFDGDMHHGIPGAIYGTYAIAKSLGFTDVQALRIGRADMAIDSNGSPYGKTNSRSGHSPSRHFNSNAHDLKKGDTRFIWAERHLNAAVKLAKRGLFNQAEKELGYGLHSLQDAFAHSQLSPYIHAVLGNIPDEVAYNPVATYEASLATRAYLKRYLDLIHTG